MVKVLIAGVLGTVVGIVVMIVVIVAAGGSTKGASSHRPEPLALDGRRLVGAGHEHPLDRRRRQQRRLEHRAAATSTAGKAVFASNGCGSCHTLAVAGATGTIGPDLGKVVAGDATKDHMPIGAFIKQSITDPAAFTASGGPWATPMPTTFGSSLSASQIADLVALIESGQTS